MNYTAKELDDILARHADDERGLRLFGFAVATVAGFISAVVMFCFAKWMGWW